MINLVVHIVFALEYQSETIPVSLMKEMTDCGAFTAAWIKHTFSLGLKQRLIDN